MIKHELDWIKKWACYTPERMALREHDRDLQWSYFEMSKRVDSLANHLYNEYNIRSGERVAVFSHNRAEYVFLFFACMRLGAILVPLNFRLMPRELDILIGDAEPALLIYEKELTESVQEMQNLGPVKNRIQMEDITAFVTENVICRQFAPAKGISEESPVMILYTSGTTGLPKGAIITHKMLYWNSINTGLRLDLNSMDHTQSFAPFFHTGGWNVLMTPFFHHGASHTLLSSFEPELILNLMEKEKTTLLFGVPTMLQMMSDTDSFNQVDLSSVRYAIVGGAPMPIPLINTWHEKGIYIRQGYGLTEVGPNCFSLHQDDAIRKKGSIGFPNFYIDAKIADENGNECGPDEVGELYLKSPVVTPGYWRKEEETALAITDGWFHTGDMLRKDAENFYYVVDRKKNMIISGGENVYPAEVEAFLVTHPAIKEVSIIGVADERWGEVGKAFIVPDINKVPVVADIIEFCRGQLAKYKIPKYFEFLDELPQNEAGKINRQELERIHSQSQT